MAEICLHVADEQNRRERCGYDGRIVRVEGQIYVVRGFGHVVDLQTEEDRDINPPCATPARMPRRDDVAVRKDASNVRPRRYEKMMCTRYDGKLRTVNL